MPHSIRPGDTLAGRYRLVDLLTESGSGRFWRAHDKVLERHVALHVIDADDRRAPALLDAARQSATVHDRRILRVLDAETYGDVCYVVNEWGAGISLDILVADSGPLGPRRAAWLVAEVADSLAAAHRGGVAHGRLVPENVLVDRHGGVRIIGFCVDAALHGLPIDRTTTDVSDLAGLLYCALTAKWAGNSTSAVPPAPSEHGVVLRPRRVRAGIPRPLDLLCDQVLHPHLEGRAREVGDLASARGIADFLGDFVGDPSGMPAALVASAPRMREMEQVVLPEVPEIPARPDPDRPAPAAYDDQPEASPTPPAPAPPGAPPEVEEPTEAGLPIFSDDDVSWLQARSTPAPPPPPFEERPERPLFAPEPADGKPVRQSRPPAPGAATKGYWPWEASTGPGAGGGSGAGSSTGTGAGTSGLRAIRDAGDDDEVPGRSWLRLAAALAAGLLLLVAIVVAYNLGRGKTVTGGEPVAEDPAPSAPRTSAPTTAAAAPLGGLVATDFDPQGEDLAENSEDAPLAVDGDVDTTWATVTYDQQFGPVGLKTGVGLVIDLGETREVSGVDLALVGSSTDTPTGVSLYLSDTEPAAIADLTTVADDVATGDRLELELEATGRFLVVWLTSLPSVDDGFRGGVAEVVVLGE
ncbi:MAG: protein kinase family protein [Nocardioides sp.]